MTLVEQIRHHYARVCQCEWDDESGSMLSPPRPDCMIHGDASDPLDELIRQLDERDSALAAAQVRVKTLEQIPALLGRAVSWTVNPGCATITLAPEQAAALDAALSLLAGTRQP